MDLMVRVYLERAENEIVAAEALNRISDEIDAKQYFGINEEVTFYSSVISHSYYAIFYSAKAILLTKDIKTSAPEIHKKTFDAFKENFVDNGILDVKLLEIYKKMAVRADKLLEIFPKHEADYTKRRVVAGIETKVIYTRKDGPVENANDPSKLRTAKYVLSDKLPITADISIFDDKVAIATYKAKPVGVIIEDKDIAATMKALFYLIWNS